MEFILYLVRRWETSKILCKSRLIECEIIKALIIPSYKFCRKLLECQIFPLPKMRSIGPMQYMRFLIIISVSTWSSPVCYQNKKQYQPQLKHRDWIPCHYESYRIENIETCKVSWSYHRKTQGLLGELGVYYSHHRHKGKFPCGLTQWNFFPQNCMQSKSIEKFLWFAIIQAKQALQEKNKSEGI